MSIALWCDLYSWIRVGGEIQSPGNSISGDDEVELQFSEDVRDVRIGDILVINGEWAGDYQYELVKVTSINFEDEIVTADREQFKTSKFE